MHKLSCGHSVDNLLDSYVVAVEDEEYNYYNHSVFPAVKYMGVCKECYDMYFDSDLLLLTREDEENYLLRGV
jgi:hypothetical protein